MSGWYLLAQSSYTISVRNTICLYNHCY